MELTGLVPDEGKGVGPTFGWKKRNRFGTISQEREKK